MSGPREVRVCSHGYPHGVMVPIPDTWDSFVNTAAVQLGVPIGSICNARGTEVNNLEALRENRESPFFIMPTAGHPMAMPASWGPTIWAHHHGCGWGGHGCGWRGHGCGWGGHCHGHHGHWC